MTTARFYDDLATYYDLIFQDWELSMSRQGAAIDQLIRRELGSDHQPPEIGIIDASAGIGTQALPLALQGYRVTARDISPDAIARLQREAAQRGLDIPSAVADMRALRSSVSEPFHVVLSFDNSLPHLLTDADLLTAFREFMGTLRPGGIVLCSVRDYDRIDRAETSTHPYGTRWRGGVEYRLRQDWTWRDAAHYDATMVIEEKRADDWREVVRTTMTYYAVPIARLMELMSEAGFVGVARDDAALYQPVLIGHRKPD
jgi:SAM-dependent methyltransferase